MIDTGSLQVRDRHNIVLWNSDDTILNINRIPGHESLIR